MSNGPSWQQDIRELVEQLVQSQGLELVDVERVTENQNKILRLIVDKRGGVSLDDCTAVSELADPLIDTLALNHDYFEVSSPGIDRPLKTDSDLARYQGAWVKATCYKAQDGRKRFEGRLVAFTPDTVSLELEDGTHKALARRDVAHIKRMIRL